MFFSPLVFLNKLLKKSLYESVTRVGVDLMRSISDPMSEGLSRIVFCIINYL